MKKLSGLLSKLLFVFGILLIIVTVSVSCTKSSMGYNTGSGNGSTPPAGAIQGANEVWIQNMAFSPSPLTIAAGTTVTWTNKMGITHTVTSDAGLFDSGNLNPNGTFSFTFVNAGTYTYHCNIHSSMTATVIVN
jgi:plastocyanin